MKDIPSFAQNDREGGTILAEPLWILEVKFIISCYSALIHLPSGWASCQLWFVPRAKRFFSWSKLQCKQFWCLVRCLSRFQAAQRIWADSDALRSLLQVPAGKSQCRAPRFSKKIKPLLASHSFSLKKPPAQLTKFSLASFIMCEFSGTNIHASSTLLV